MTYYAVCLGSATIGSLGSLLFLYQVLCGAASKSISKSQKNILINLGIADFFADIGNPRVMQVIIMTSCAGVCRLCTFVNGQ
jgi:hypothetical protein